MTVTDRVATDLAPLAGLQPGHGGLNVTDLDRSVDFYRAVLGLVLVRASDEAGRRYAFLGDGRRVLLTLWQQSEGRFDAGRPGLHHLAFQVDDVAQLRDLERRLRERGAVLLYDGIVPHEEGADNGGLYFEDPDGTRLEVYAPTGAGGRPAPAGPAPSCGFF
jgi:lactoylglutathione lyase